MNVRGTTSGRFDSSKPNQGNAPKREIEELARQLIENHQTLHKLDPMRPKVGVEMTPGRKYLLIVDVRQVETAIIEKLSAAAPMYEAEFKARGLDVTFLATQWPIAVYELEGK
jgi:hypothetical protein